MATARLRPVLPVFQRFQPADVEVGQEAVPLSEGGAVQLMTPRMLISELATRSLPKCIECLDHVWLDLHKIQITGATDITELLQAPRRQADPVMNLLNQFARVFGG